jgi:hypothetical protein
MRDRDIRATLRNSLRLAHQNEPDTLFIDELGLCQGIVRVDFAVINGSLNGYEIKSEMDTLDRLPGQQAVYNKTLNTVTIVASGGHIPKIKNMVPEWWGITEAVSSDCGVELRQVRGASPNTHIEPFAVVQLLWRDEVLSILKELQLDKGIQNKPRRVLWKKLIENRSVEELCQLVRTQLKVRGNWRVAESLVLNDD